MAKKQTKTRQVKYRLAGTVQGVGFRRFISDKANDYNATGYAANESDGSLTVLLSAGDDALGKLQAHLYQGPPNAHVVAVTELIPDQDDAPATDEFIIR